MVDRHTSQVSKEHLVCRNTSWQGHLKLGGEAEAGARAGAGAEAYQVHDRCA